LHPGNGSQRSLLVVFSSPCAFPAQAVAKPELSNAIFSRKSSMEEGDSPRGERITQHSDGATASSADECSINPSQAGSLKASGKKKNKKSTKLMKKGKLKKRDTNEVSSLQQVVVQQDMFEQETPPEQSLAKDLQRRNAADEDVGTMPRESASTRLSYGFDAGDHDDAPLPCPNCGHHRTSYVPHRGGLKRTKGTRERRVGISNGRVDVKEYQEDEDIEPGARVVKRRSSAMAVLQSLTNTSEGGFSCCAHVLLALIGGGRQTRTSCQQAAEAFQAGDGCSCFLYLTIIVFGHLFIFLLPPAFIFCGLTYVHQKGPRVEDIEELVKVSSKQPYWMILMTSILGAASTALIMGPPAFKAGSTGAWQTMGRIAKIVFTLYLLFRTVYTWGEELAVLRTIFDREFSRHLGLSTVVRTLMLSMVQSATSSQWSRYADQLVLMLVYNDYLNFRKAHEDGFVKNWRQYMDTVEKAEEGNELTMVAFKSRPYSKEKGKLIFTMYIAVLLVRCWTFGWGVALVYFPLFTILYPWVILIVLMFMILMRLILVESLMWILIKLGNQGCCDRLLALLRLLCCRGDREVEDLDSELHFETPDGNPDTIKLYPRPGHHVSVDDDRKHLRTIANAMASTGFLPGNFDRALWPQLQCCGKPMPRLPGLLYTNISSEKGSQEELRRNYEHEVAVLQATGITRDGWCYVIIYAAIGKVMVDFMVVVLTRFMAGVGYMDCVVLTLTDRSWQRWMEQFDYMDTINRINRW
ncbi:unnamed protein product, partial [Durusdinium trenchii]